MAHGADYLRRPDKNTIPESTGKIKGNALPSKTWIATGGETPPLILPSCSHAGVVLSRRLSVDADMSGHCTNPTIQPCDPAAILPDRRLAARLFSAKCHLNLSPPAETDGTRDSSGNNMPQPGERSSADFIPQHGASTPNHLPRGSLAQGYRLPRFSARWRSVGKIRHRGTETQRISKLMPKKEAERSHPQGGRLVVASPQGAPLTRPPLCLCVSVVTKSRRSVA